jgi:hypothetical protein
MSTIAVFGLLTGGTAYAAATIGSDNIKRNAVLSRHIKNGQVRTTDPARDQSRHFFATQLFVPAP